MPSIRGSQEQQQAAEESTSTGFKGFIKDRSLVEVKFTIVSRTLRHKDESYLPSGTLMKARDEVVMGIVFDSEEDALGTVTVKGEIPEVNEEYGCSTGSKEIVSLLRLIPDSKLPLPDVTIREHKDRRPFIPVDDMGQPRGTINKDGTTTGDVYYQLFLDDFEVPPPDPEPEPGVFDLADDGTVEKAIVEPMTLEQFSGHLKTRNITLQQAMQLLGVKNLKGLNLKDALSTIAKKQGASK